MRARWSIRLLLAALLAFGSEVLLWTNPLNRPWWEWGLALAGYVVLSAILLDVLARYNVRDLLGLMALAGVYGLGNGLLINPELTLFDVPRTLVTRVTGAHTLIGLEMLIVFLALTGAGQRHLRRIVVIGALAVGLAWGVWARWATDFAEVTYSASSLVEMLLVGAVGIGVMLAAAGFAFRAGRSVTPPEILLNRVELALIGLAVATLVFIRLVQGWLGVTGLLLTATLLVISGMLLWFRRNTRLKPIIVDHLPLQPLGWVWIALLIAVLLWSGVLGYSLPLIGTEEDNQFRFVVNGFTLYGLAWLPAVSLTHGARAYIRQVQSSQE